MSAAASPSAAIAAAASPTDTELLAATHIPAGKEVVGRCPLCPARDNNVVLRTEAHDVCECPRAVDRVCWHHACATRTAERRGIIKMSCAQCGTVLRTEDTYYDTGDRRYTFLPWWISRPLGFVARMLLWLLVGAVLFAAASCVAAYVYKALVAARYYVRTPDATVVTALTVWFGVHDTYSYHQGWAPTLPHMALGSALMATLLMWAFAAGVAWSVLSWTRVPQLLHLSWRWMVNVVAGQRYKPVKQKAAKK